MRTIMAMLAVVGAGTASSAEAAIRGFNYVWLENPKSDKHSPFCDHK